jgi:hypothetical protein
MKPFAMIVGHEFLDDLAQVPLAEEDESAGHHRRGSRKR